MTSILFVFMGLFINFSWQNKVYLMCFMLLFTFGNMPLSYSFYGSWLYVDMLSFSLIFLTFLISIFVVLSSYSILKQNYSASLYLMLIYMLTISLFLSFSNYNFLMFYFFFECCLIPIFLMVMGWGFQPERLQSSLYLLFYTLFGSLPLLIVIFCLYKLNGSFSFNLLETVPELSGVLSGAIFFSLALAFLIKSPIYMLHLWLPKAHVEAPVGGSMILAGVLLKLGGYGLFRVSSILVSNFYEYSSYIMGIGMSSLVFLGFICSRVNDVKSLIAYSSVIHMSLVLCGFFTYFCWGQTGMTAMMFSHGLVSSGFFCLLNVYYERSSGRSIFLNKGFFTILPSISLFSFLFSSASLPSPPAINFFSEIFLMFSIIGYSWLSVFFLFVGSFLGAVYTLFLFSSIFHGKNFGLLYSLSRLSSREMHVMMCHLFPIVLFSSKMVIFLL